MAAIMPSERPYLKTSIFEHAKHRIVWLMVLMISATFTGAIISSFEDAFKVIPVLVAFIPMLMDTGGNSVSQTSTLIIRGMALGEIEGRDVLRVWWHEIAVSLILGAALAAVSILKTYFLNGRDMWLSITVSLSLYATVIIAQSIGCLLPIAVKKVGLDPAVAASPIITTIVDACALSIYFAVAKTFMGL